MKLLVIFRMVFAARLADTHSNPAGLRKLKRLESEIRDDAMSCDQLQMAMGTALRTIKQEQLYCSEGFHSFASYVDQVGFPFGSARALQLIRFVDEYELALREGRTPPANERQARAMRSKKPQVMGFEQRWHRCERGVLNQFNNCPEGEKAKFAEALARLAESLRQEVQTSGANPTVDPCTDCTNKKSKTHSPPSKPDSILKPQAKVSPAQDGPSGPTLEPIQPEKPTVTAARQTFDGKTLVLTGLPEPGIENCRPTKPSLFGFAGISMDEAKKRGL